MKDFLRAALPLSVFVAVVFGLTFLAQYRVRPPDAEESKPQEPPLRFGSSARRWDPTGSLQDQIFPGFFEVQANAAGPKNAARFWFENRNPQPVTLRLRGVSCSSCSAGRVAAIPPETTRCLLQMCVVSGLPQGLGGGLTVGMVGPAALLDPDRLTWQQYEFRETPHATFTIPAADNRDGLSPQWGILELQFTVGALGVKTLTAEFELQVQGRPDVQIARFDITFEGVNPFEVAPPRLDVGELMERSGPQTYELLVYSSTRGPTGSGPGVLPPPSVDVRLPPGASGEVGRFVTVGQPVRVPESELVPMSLEVSKRLKKPTRVEAAYRLPVTIDLRAGQQPIDIGPLERDIWVAVPDALPRSVPVRGRVRGSVWLDNDLRDISLSYQVTSGLSDRLFRLIADGANTELVPVPAECRPEFLKIILEKEEVQPSDRTIYRLKLSVPPNARTGGWSGAVVLELKSTGQRVRIPVRGNGRL